MSERASATIMPPIEYSELCHAEDRFSHGDLLKVITGEEDGHYWTSVSTGEILCEGTVTAGDYDAFSSVSRNLLYKNRDCQYGGQITEEEARARYRAELWKVWQNLYNKEDLL